MSIAPLLMAMKMASSLNPMTMALILLGVSLLTSVTIFKTALMSWISFVLILTFSSGMMTLFMYVTAMAPNEKNTTKKSLLIMMVMVVFMSLTQKFSSNKQKSHMKMFTNSTLLFMMVLIGLTMLAISSHGHHPNQTLATSF